MALAIAFVHGLSLRHSTEPRSRKPLISPAEKPNSARISSVCSANSGVRRASLLGVRLSVNGWRGSFDFLAVGRGHRLAEPQVLRLRVVEGLLDRIDRAAGDFGGLSFAISVAVSICSVMLWISALTSLRRLRRTSRVA